MMNKIVGVSDMKISNNPEETLITYSLGSCIGVAIYDSTAKVGGLLHFMLPESSINPEKAQENPFMFADTGIPRLFRSVYEYGASKQRLKIVTAGGSQLLDQKGFFNIGKRNDMAVRKIFHRNNVMIDYSDIGGVVNRTVLLAIKDGQISIKISGQKEIIV